MQNYFKESLSKKWEYENGEESSSTDLLKILEFSESEILCKELKNKQKLQKEFEKLTYQKEKRNRYQSLNKNGRDYYENERIIQQMESMLGIPWQLGWRNWLSISCSMFISRFVKGCDGSVDTIDKQLGSWKLEFDEVNNGDLIIWRWKEEDHIEFVIEKPVYDFDKKTYLVKTLWSAKCTQAFDRKWNLVTKESLIFELRWWIGYWVGYRVREFRQKDTTTFQELPWGWHYKAVAYFKRVTQVR